MEQEPHSWLANQYLLHQLGSMGSRKGDLAAGQGLEEVANFVEKEVTQKGGLAGSLMKEADQVVVEEIQAKEGALVEVVEEIQVKGGDQVEVEDCLKRKLALEEVVDCPKMEVAQVEGGDLKGK